jgi:RHS repeat-associated protein
VSSGTVTSFVTDALGSTLALTDGSASTTASYSYGAYGNASKTGSDDTPFQYTGRENDGAANLYYYRARYYNPTFGQFISADPIGLAGGLNAYAYVGGNPLSYVDPLGLKLCKIKLPGKGNTYLDDSIAKEVQDWIALNQAAGIPIRVTSAFRTTASQGSLNSSNAITPAPAGHSLHEAGFAIDINWNSLNSAQQDTVLDNADQVGLDWGGDFRKADPVHFYSDPGHRAQHIKDAQQQYKNGVNCDCN